MPITYPGKISTAETTVARNDVSAADSTTINDTNFPPADATDCAGWESVMLFPRHTGGTNPTTAIQVLYRCGSGWAVGATTAALAEGTVAVVNTYGRKCFFRISALTGTPDSVDVHCAGAVPFRYDGPQRG